MSPGAGAIPFEMTRNSKRRMRFRDSDGIRDLHGDTFAALGVFKRSAKIADPFMKDMESAQNAELVV